MSRRPTHRRTATVGGVASVAAWILLVGGLVACGLPLLATVMLAITSPPVDAAGGTNAMGSAAGMPLPSPGGTPPVIAGRTIAWSAGVGVMAVLAGWLPGRWLGRARGRGRGLLAAMVLLPATIPAYASFHAWWQAWPVGSPLHRWVVARDLVPEARAVTLAVALVAWSWPIVAACVAPAAARHAGRREDAMRLDGVGRWRRSLVAARLEWPAAVLGGLLVMVLVAGDTTAFDLAQVYVIGNELRAMDALGRSPRELVAVGWPFLLPALLGAGVVWVATRPGGRRPGDGDEPAMAGGMAIACTAGLLAVTVAAPLWLSIAGLPERADVAGFMRLNGGGLSRSMLLAGTVAATAAAACLVSVVAMTAPGRGRAATTAAIGLAALLTPAFLFTAGVEAVWNRGWPGGGASDPLSPATLIYRTPAVLVLAAVARTAAPAILLARWAADGRPAATRELCRLEDVGGPIARVRQVGPRAVSAAVAAATIAFVQVLGDASVVVRLAPPGFDPIAGTLLNAMHYQRGDTVLLGVLAIVAAAAVAAASLALGTGIGGRSGFRTAGMLIVSVAAAGLIGGCGGGGGDGGDGTPPLPSPRVHGFSGTGPGQFSYPRAIAADADRGRIYVIDKTARVQVFGDDGGYLMQWRMPEFDQGKPTGISVGPDGTVWVADTHENRVMGFSPEGLERRRFGGPGTEPGRFVYPTDVAVDPSGLIYVSEYGGNDRIQVFTPEGAYLRSIGRFGTGDDAFNRPQALLFTPDGRRLLVADSCNHRIVVLDPVTGAFERVIGGPGTEPGRFHYPYEIAWFEEGVLLVSEFGNNRIQLVDLEGRSLGRGGGVGATEGRLKYPWGAVRLADRVFVLDSGNNRMQGVPAARLRSSG
jgi:DNA-binding beta-propeller fold protein YncE/ABC-type Fe3+ transport system permease subunit